MTLIAWQADFETGIASVDLEHRELLTLINRLHAELEPDCAAVAAFLDEVLGHVSAHFALEEKIMRDTGYDDYELHRRDHQQLLDAIRDIMDDHRRGHFANAPDLLAGRLRSWLEEHFRGHDARLGHITEGGGVPSA